MTNPIPSIKPIPTPLAQRYQTYALIAWLTVLMLVTMVFLPTPRTPLTFATYQAMDQASKPIDCGLLMSDLRSADRGLNQRQNHVLVIDAEQQHHYSFKACRADIDQEAARFCNDQVSGIMMGYDTSAPLNARCVPVVRQAIRNTVPAMSVNHGWATLGSLRLQLTQVVSVRVTPIVGFAADPDAPQYLEVTTNAPSSNRFLYVLPNPAAGKQWVQALTGDGKNL